MSGSWPRPDAPERRALLALCGDLRDAIADMETQATEASTDRDEVVLKLDTITARIIEAREEYLAAVSGGRHS